ncbi:MAG: Serine/threonine-protein kinase PknD [bacterium]|nr:Serine/threonine-protein kinase PknD [bacterium]
MVVNRWEGGPAPPQARPATREPEGLALKLEGKRLDEWQVGEYIDEGAFGVVHRASHFKSGDVAALKILKPNAVNPKRLERFQREGIALMRVTHPNVVQLFGTGRAEVLGTSIFYLALELLEGKTLEQEVTERGRLPEGQALWIASQVVQALLAVEAHRIVHGDLKPSNVYLTNDGRVKVMDFGHSTLLEFDNLTRHGSFVGTAPFAAPEQFIDSSQVDSKADQYSLGCLLYYMLTGVPPFPEAHSLEAQSSAHQHDQPLPARRRNPQVTSFASALCNRLMSKRKAERFAQLQDIAMLLQSREQSNFYYSLFPESHRRSDSPAFWSNMIFPRFPAPRCPADPLPPLALHLREQTRHFRMGKGCQVPVLARRGQGTSRAVYEAFVGNKELQLVRTWTPLPGEPALTPLVSVFHALFPHHQHPKFAWEEQFRHLTKEPPDAYATLRILLKDPAGYESHFGPERDLRLANEVVLVLSKLAEDLPLVLLWDHCEDFQQRCISLLMKVLPKLEAAPVLNICAGLPVGIAGVAAAYPAWAALVRSLERQSQRYEPFTPAPLETAQLQRLLGYFIGDPAVLKHLIQTSRSHQFASYREFFTWTAYWMEALHHRKQQHGRASLTPGDLTAMRDPLLQGSVDQLQAARWAFLSPLQQRTLTIMAEQGEFFRAPTPRQYREAPTGLEITRLCMDLERRWYIHLFRNHGQFRGTEWVSWIRNHPAK